MAKSKVQQIREQEKKDEELLLNISLLDAELMTRAKITADIKERRDFLLQEAVDRKITRAGDYKLISKERVNRKVDMLAIEALLTQPQFMEIAHVSLKDAEKYLSKQQIEKVTSKTISVYYQVQEIYKPTELK
jgi:predicted DNA-binding protein